METTIDAILAGFEWDAENHFFSYQFGDGYELTLEPLLFDGQFYFALYKDKSLLIPKIVFTTGKKYEPLRLCEHGGIT